MHACSLVWVCLCCKCTCLWRPEAHVRSLSWSLSTPFIEVGSQLNPELVCPPALINQPVFISPYLCLLSTGITGGPLHCLDIYVGSGNDLHSAQASVAVSLTTKQSPELCLFDLLQTLFCCGQQFWL